MDRVRTGVLNATVVRLLLAAFIVALATTGFMFAAPFCILAKLGRTDAVGQVVATWTAGYIASCLVAQYLARRISPRVLVTIATVGVGLFIFLFRFPSTVPWMSAVGLGYGVLMGFFWPPLMGWLSGDAEGVMLSRRLGWFNIAWSSSIIIAPAITGYLVKYSIVLPFGVMAAIMAAACLVVLTTRHTTGEPAAVPDKPTAFPVVPVDQAPLELADPIQPAPQNMTPVENEIPLMSAAKMRYIRYFAWSGAIVGYLAIAVFRYQMPHLAKTVHMDEVVFGRVATALSLAVTAAFFVTARWTGWHGKTRWIFLPQVLLVIVSGLLTWATTAWAMVPLMLVAGLCAGLLYTNSVFYGSLGAPASVRTRRMAIHEICLNIGQMTGSYFGNQLSQHLGPSRVYPYLAMAVALALLLELALWNLLSLRRQPGAVASVGTAALESSSEPATMRQKV